MFQSRRSGFRFCDNSVRVPIFSNATFQSRRSGFRFCDTVELTKEKAPQKGFSPGDRDLGFATLKAGLIKLSDFECFSPGDRDLGFATHLDLCRPDDCQSGFSPGDRDLGFATLDVDLNSIYNL